MRLRLSEFAALAAASLLAGCSGGTGPTADGAGIVNVYNWSDYIDPAVITDFQEETGIRVNYEVMDSNELLETKLLAGRSGYDVVVPSASFMARQVRAGIYQKLDKSQLPNLANLDPALLRQQQLLDPGNEYGVNYMWGTSGVAYNEARVLAALPDAPVDSFAMLFDPQVARHFASCGISILDAPSEVIGAVLIYLGRDANSEDPADLAAAEQVLLSIRPYVRLINSSRYIEDLANGEICLALGWSGDVLQARARALEAGRDVRIRYNIPIEGAVMFFDDFAIPADAGHVDNAYRFIDYMLRPEVAARNSNAVHYANSNSASWPLLSTQVGADPGIYPPPEVMARLVPDIPESAGFTRQLTRTWTRFRTGK